MWRGGPEDEHQRAERKQILFSAMCVYACVCMRLVLLVQCESLFVDAYACHCCLINYATLRTHQHDKTQQAIRSANEDDTNNDVAMRRDGETAKQ